MIHFPELPLPGTLLSGLLHRRDHLAQGNILGCFRRSLIGRFNLGGNHWINRALGRHSAWRDT